MIILTKLVTVYLGYSANRVGTRRSNEGIVRIVGVFHSIRISQVSELAGYYEYR